jgi:hypothetical protein
MHDDKEVDCKIDGMSIVLKNGILEEKVVADNRARPQLP